MSLDVLIVQHADKITLAGDHGLTERGRGQAQKCGELLAGLAPFAALWCSPLRRSRETAAIIAAELGFPEANLGFDPRISERINWWNDANQTREEFRAEWERSTADRDFQPRFGDSSRTAGARFAEFLFELWANPPGDRVLVVSHGGVTVDLMRTLFGDDKVNERAPGAIDHGIPACSVSWMRLRGRELVAMAADPDVLVTAYREHEARDHRFRVIDQMRAAFADVPAEELEEEGRKAVAAVRAEQRPS